MSPSETALIRLLRQWRELGVEEMVLEHSDRRSFLERLAAGGGVPRLMSQGDAPEVGEERDTEEASAPGSYEALREEALACTRCRLAQGRTQVVFSDGVRHARLMVVGEAPGEHEDRTGRPFVGRAGRLLDLLLASVDLTREESVYICNVLKCRPPGNRDPRQDEIESCAPYLLRQIDLVRPEAILAVGTFSGRLLTGMDRPLGRLRGKVYSYHETPLVVTYHPAALLRNRGWTQAAWDDLQLLRTVLDGSGETSTLG